MKIQLPACNAGRLPETGSPHWYRGGGMGYHQVLPGIAALLRPSGTSFHASAD